MKKRILAVMLAIITVFSVMSVLASAQTIKAGEVTGDGKVTAADARKVLRVAATLEAFDDENLFTAADVNLDGRITAADARKILRAAATLEVLPEITTKEPETEEVSSEEPATEEPTTEEPTTEEPTTEADTGVVVTELPEDIEAFFAGKFYLECDMSADGDTSTIKLAQKDKKLEASMSMDGFEISVYTDGKTIYIKFPYNNKTYYIEMDKNFLEDNGIDLNVEDVVAQLSFGKLEDFNAPVLTKEEYNGESYDVYTFVDKDGFSLCFYVDGRDDVKYIISKNVDGQIETEIQVAKLSASIPSDMLTVKRCEKGNLITLMSAMTAFGEKLEK